MTMAQKINLDERITFRVTPEERTEADALREPRESLGDLMREALQREIQRRKRAKKKAGK